MGSAEEEREESDRELHICYVVATMLLFADYAATAMFYDGQC